MLFIPITFIITLDLKIISSSASEIIIIIHRYYILDLTFLKLVYVSILRYVLYVQCRGRAVTNVGKTCGPTPCLTRAISNMFKLKPPFKYFLVFLSSLKILVNGPSPQLIKTPGRALKFDCFLISDFCVFSDKILVRLLVTEETERLGFAEGEYDLTISVSGLFVAMPTASGARASEIESAGAGGKRAGFSMPLTTIGKVTLETGFTNFVSIETTP